MNRHKINLGFFPTPLHPLNNLSKLFPEYSIYIKRDDQTGLATGGNKTRKLEYLMQEAINLKCDTIITAGAQQSNHCRQTAAACAQLGLDCHLLLGGERPEEYEGNLLLSSLLGATIHFTGDHRKGENINELMAVLESQHKKCYVIPYGGSNLIGATGFIQAVSELKQQLTQQQLVIDYIFFASSSGGMQAGLTLGLEIHNLDATLVPISIDKLGTQGITLEQLVWSIVSEGAMKYNIPKNFKLSDMSLNRDYDAHGYGNVTQNEQRIIKLMAEKEGILLDPVYTGRAFTGMIDMLELNKIPKKANVLFWHTGGSPAIFKYGKDLL